MVKKSKVKDNPITEETPKDGSYAVNDKEAAFLERIAKASAKAETGGMEGGEVLDFPIGDKVIGEFGGFTVIESEKKGKTFRILHLKTADGEKRYWTFGLLDFHLKKWDAKLGDIIVVMKKAKNEEGFWGGEFMHAPSDDGK